jgi:hypothetical protein
MKKKKKKKKMVNVVTVDLEAIVADVKLNSHSTNGSKKLCFRIADIFP